MFTPETLAELAALLRDVTDELESAHFAERDGREVVLGGDVMALVERARALLGTVEAERAAAATGGAK